MNNIDKPITAEEVIQFRAKHNLSMRDLADKAQLSLQTIWLIENRQTTASRLSTEKLYRTFAVIEYDERRNK